MVAYCVACGMPFFIVSSIGNHITNELPQLVSLSDFVGWRFGPIAKTMVFLITVFVQSIYMLTEYTTIGSIFSGYVGSVSW